MAVVIRTSLIAVLAVALGCGPEPADPVDPEALALCDALYERAAVCGSDIPENAAETCARNPRWDTSCRALRVEQYECFAALTCGDEAEQTPAFAACEKKLQAFSDCDNALRGG